MTYGRAAPTAFAGPDTGDETSAHARGTNIKPRPGLPTSADPVSASGLNAAIANPKALTFVQVSSGEGGVAPCAITSSGAAYCWGANTFGELGTGSPRELSTAPVAVAGGLRFVQMSEGGATCGLTITGAAYCWGDNTWGELGNGSTTHDSDIPVAVNGGLTFTAVSAGFTHTCAITAQGAAYCWGLNIYGQLGAGSTVDSAPTPVQVAGGLSFSQLSAGDAFTCGLTGVGGAYCWGTDSYGELGTMATARACRWPTDIVSCSRAPVAVSGGLTFATVSAGRHAACALTPEGTAYCWGDNTYGQLGTGSTTGPQLCYPVDADPSPCSPTPVAVAGSITFAAINAGDDYVCALTTGGTVYCWGDNNYGQLGNGTMTGSSTPGKVRVRPQ